MPSVGYWSVLIDSRAAILVVSRECVIGILNWVGNNLTQLFVIGLIVVGK